MHFPPKVLHASSTPRKSKNERKEISRAQPNSTPPSHPDLTQPCHVDSGRWRKKKQQQKKTKPVIGRGWPNDKLSGISEEANVSLFFGPRPPPLPIDNVRGSEEVHRRRRRRDTDLEMLCSVLAWLRLDAFASHLRISSMHLGKRT